MKRKASCAARPTKKQRVETRKLINKLQDDEEDENERRRVDDAKKAVEMAYEEGIKKIRKEFRTLRPENVLPERRLQLEQKLEYEETLKTDRMSEIDSESRARVKSITNSRLKRVKAQEVDEKIEECGDIATQEFSSASWQMIGKLKCCVARIADVDMSENQRTRYDEVLHELKQKGWRTYQNKNDIKASVDPKNDATAAPSKQATESSAQ